MKSGCRDCPERTFDSAWMGPPRVCLPDQGSEWPALTWAPQSFSRRANAVSQLRVTPQLLQGGRLCPRPDVWIGVSKSKPIQVLGRSSLMVPSPSCSHHLACRTAWKPGVVSGPSHREAGLQPLCAVQGPRKQRAVYPGVAPRQPLTCGGFPSRMSPFLRPRPSCRRSAHP